jgi:hypothetical protein
VRSSRRLRRCLWPGAACGRRPYDPARFRRPAVSPVFLSAVTDYAADLAEVLRGMREPGVTVAGKRVLLKPNLVEYEPGAAIIRIRR